ncbi:DUF11 domain-containing protein [Pimelobacter sp. 30-1]|uniref:DUF11 domain-containing protein n=1 Tax=Pimelobacter sp. 30-1 TaxID=2004991 RepID=UPI001C05B95C|nr:DUF11 domain-containing protein [Pimelobacter sp. 30-1]MBU2695827.1 hypothetical protein [Pimelobacter sp. 30-1]
MNATSPLVTLAGLTAAAGLAVVGLAPAAHAAPGDPFDPAKPTVYIVQGNPSQLQIAEPDANGNFSFGAEGGPSGVQYNGLSFSTEDNYLYGFAVGAGNGIPTGSLVRIGQGGTSTRVGTATWELGGTSFNLGAIDPASGNIYAAVHTATQMYVIDPATGVQVGNTIPLTGSMASYGDVSDWTFSGGFLWGVGANRTMVRITPADGTVTTWTLSDGRVDTGFTGAAWTYADGSMGFSHNATGQVERIQVTSPAAANPTFTVVKVSTGPSSSANDGAASPGLPADLALTKTSRDFAPGATVSYTLTVTNKGRGWSTGWSLEDAVPAVLTDVTATTAAAGTACQVAGNDVTCTGGELAPGDAVAVEVTGKVPAGFTGTVRNRAEVTGNEDDPVLANNTAAVTDRTQPDPDGSDPDGEDPVVPENPSVPAGGADDGTGTPWSAITGLAGFGLALAAGLTAFATRRRGVEG